MVELSSGEATRWLWWITWVNVAGGLVIWVFNWFREIGALRDLESRDPTRRVRENEEILLSAAVWQEIGASLASFGILVLVITLATSAIVASLKKTQ